jgi:cell wall-associated NlpC family hydrolase
MNRLAMAFILFLFQPVLAGAADYGVARSLTPVLNTPAFPAVFGGQDGRTLKTDRCGQVRELEFIALPGTSFRIVKELAVGKVKVLQVETKDYQARQGVLLYIDSRSLEPSVSEPPPRRREPPKTEEISDSLKKAVGAPYVWGGNALYGVPGLSGLYTGGDAVSSEESMPLLAGLDCSGLLYQATDGWTPRNTAQLLKFGRAVPIAGKTSTQLAELLRPLDLIVWNGHIIIVLERETTIESRLLCGKKGNGGVVTSPLLQRLKEVMHTKRPLDSWPAEGKQRGAFVVRRWYGY